jgi:NADP-dependent 3-hydroxy acid dehydrogenase YdfG
MRRIALVTGATAGIGKATAEILAQNGYNLIITGRRKEQLEMLKNQIGIKYKVDVLALSFDIRDRQQTESVIDKAVNLKQWKNVSVLVNNAGLSAGLSPVHQADIDDWEVMIDTNVKGLLYVSRKIAPLMVENGSGHIVNISSIAAKELYEGGNVYCATKHAVDALTKGMRIDLVKHNVKVTSISPGFVETEFSIVRFKGNKERASKVYEGMIPLSAEDVAEAVWFAVSRPQHVNINDILIVPTAQANITTVVRK